MANKDSLGDRMKENYEKRFNFKLLRRTPVIIRLDGRAFHSFTKGFNKPFDKVLSNAMDRTMKQLCENIQGCVFGYTQSDEITLVLNDYRTLETSAWFNNEVQKISSVAASMATMYFNRNFSDEVQSFYSWVYFNDYEINEKFPKENKYMVPDSKKAVDLIGVYQKKVFTALFDARCFNIPESEVTNCTIWRQQDCSRNSIEMVGRTYFSDKELFKRNCSNIQDMLMEKYNVNWNDFPVRYKRGCACYKTNMSENECEHSKWIIDYDMPIITQNREYVEKWIRLEN